MAPPALVIDRPIDHADLVGLYERVRVLLEAGDARVIVCDVGRIPEADFETVAILARLQLTARRCGGRVHVLNASSGLHEVLALAGLCHVVGVCPPSGPEAQRQPEHREEARGVEEERDPADPIA
jgi:ABC-type transporter Mla MlaB component